jgi:hypothetical protein
MLFDNAKFVVVYVEANAQRREEAIEHNATADAVQAFHSKRRVRHIPLRDVPPERHCFEVVDKRTNMEVFLEGTWAEYFQRVIDEWHVNVPSEEEVESVLDEIVTLAQIPMVMH